MERVSKFAKRYIIPGGDHDGSEPECSPWAWELPEHQNRNRLCSGSGTLYRETAVVPFWPKKYRFRTGTVPPYVIVLCDFCAQSFIGLGPE